MSAPSTMLTLATVVVLLVAAGGALAYFVCQKAPEGHEDNTGFREIDEA